MCSRFDFGGGFRYFKSMSTAAAFVRRACFPTVAAIVALQFVSPLHAEDPLPQVERLKSSPVLQHLKPNPIAGEPKTAAERTLAQMYVPEGFKVDLIAAEPDIHQPIAFAWDERGRIWVVEAYSYPTKRPAGEGLDKVVIFADEDGDGHFETRKVFAEGLNLASGIEVGYGGVWIGAAPELLFIPDRNRDDVPDGPPQVLLDGFGYQDTHETLNSFLWGPDGWLYGIQGVFNTARIGKPGVPPEQRPELRAGVWRFHPVRHEFEIFAHGGSNPWGLDYDEHGELFMTHCRSYWGKGFTTHVIQGGQFWNQVNANYAPFIIANPPPEFPEFRNYLLASARYGHGAGGAGPRGSDAIYGGHSHVGTMIYLGDNWPDEYRGHLFTHNLGGHQINHEINEPLGSGYNTVSAGKDMLFCTDPSYVAVDLQYGPDGAVYIIDWVDPQHCHNPNTERWDRTNGRIYRMQWQATFKPVKVNLGAMSDVELVKQLKHKNQWYARTARRLLHERAIEEKTLQPQALTSLGNLLKSDLGQSIRLNALWTRYLTGDLPSKEALDTLAIDQDEHVRGWLVQLISESVSMLSNGQDSIQPRMIPDNDAALRASSFMGALAKRETSPLVRRYYASATGKLRRPSLAAALSQFDNDSDDRNLPFLIWHQLAPLISANKSSYRTDQIQWEAATEYGVDDALFLARVAKIPQLADWIYWYAATLEGEPLNRVVGTLTDLSGEALHKRLAGLWLAMEPRANLPMPAGWKDIAPKLYGDANPKVQRLAERLAAVFGDDSAFPRLRSTLADTSADADSRKHAFAVLSRAQDRASLNTFVGLLDDSAFRLPAIQLLARFDAPSVSDALIRQFKGYLPTEKSAALTTLTGRAPYAIALLEAVSSDAIPRSELTAFHVRQLTSLGNADVDRRVESLWGPIKQTPAEKLERIDRLEKVFNEAPLWAYSANAGREHFEKLCMACHKLGELGQQLGPELTGAGKHGVRYYLENIIDPDAVVGTDFELTTVETKNDEVISGLLVNETASALTLRTTVGESVVAKADIRERTKSQKSLMPEGLLEALPDREQIELLKFLTSN
jgi:putative membrane-bound dehydrogenase-like protein